MQLRRKPTPDTGPDPVGSTSSTAAASPAQPAVPARRRPALIGAGVAMVALCGLGVYSVLNSADDMHPVVMTQHAVGAGHVITSYDVTVTRVHGGEGLSTTSDVNQVVGKVPTSDIAASSLVNPAALGDRMATGPGFSTVTIALKHGAMPASGLHAGQDVRIVTQMTSATAGVKAQEWKGSVSAVGDRGDDQMTTVDVIVASTDAAPIATNAPGTLAVVIDPPTPTPTPKKVG